MRIIILISCVLSAIMGMLLGVMPSLPTLDVVAISTTTPAFQYSEIWHVTEATQSNNLVQLSLVQWNPKNNQIAVVNSGDATVKILNSDTGHLQYTLKSLSANSNTGNFIYKLSWSPDGRFLAIAFHGDVIEVWDLSLPQKSKPLTVEYQALNYSISWAADSRRLSIVKSTDGGVKGIIRETLIWDVIDNRELAHLKGDTDTVINVLWSPDGEKLVGMTSYGIAQIWDGHTYEPAINFPKIPADFLLGTDVVVWNPNGEEVIGVGCNVALGGCELWKWDILTGQLQIPFKDKDSTGRPNLDRPTSLTWRPNDSSVLYVAFNPAQTGTYAQLWGTNTGQLLATIDHILSIDWSPDGKSFTTINDDRSVSVWKISS